MKYKLTPEQKGWLEELISRLQPGNNKSLAQAWLNVADEVTEAQLDLFVDYFANDSSRMHQCEVFIQWVKGGVRPPRPH